MPRFTTFLAIVAASGTLALPLQAQDAATVIARVGDVELTLGHAIALRAQLPAQIQAAPDDRLFPALIQQMIDQEVLAQSQVVALTAADQMRLDNEVRGFLSNVALQNAVDAAVTPENLATAYGAFAEAFGAGEPVTEWNAAHILVATQDEIAAVVDQLAQGREFADVAREVSTDGSARQGGDLGWFGPGTMIPEFEDTVRNLEPGQVSEPLQTRFGWHVVRLLDSRIASVPALEEVEDRLADELRRAAVQGLIEGLRAGVEVTDLSQTLDPSLLRRDDLIAP
jgi:peptidyl-prolyl cis-trans isomerase C